MAQIALNERSAIVNSSTSGAVTIDVYTAPDDTEVLVTEVTLTTDAQPIAPLRVSLKVGGITQWPRLVNHLQPTLWRNRSKQIAVLPGQTVQLVIEQTTAVQALHYAICVSEA